MKMIPVPESLLTGLRRFLGKCPYDQVAQLIQSMDAAVLKAADEQKNLDKNK